MNEVQSDRGDTQIFYMAEYSIWCANAIVGKPESNHTHVAHGYNRHSIIGILVFPTNNYT